MIVHSPTVAGRKILGDERIEQAEGKEGFSVADT